MRNGGQSEWVDALVGDGPPGVEQAGVQVGEFQPGICRQEIVDGIPGQQHVHDLFHRQPMTADARPAAAYACIHSDARQ